MSKKKPTKEMAEKIAKTVKDLCDESGLTEKELFRVLDKAHRYFKNSPKRES